MKVIFNERKEIEINLKFPSFWKNEDTYCKVLNEEKCMRVEDLPYTYASIGFSFVGNINFQKAIEIDEQTYIDAFERVILKLK